MSGPWWRLARVLLVVGAGAGLVVGAQSLPQTIALGATVAEPSAATAGEVPTRHTLLACAGPETEGIASVPAVSGGTTTVTAALPPAAALAGIAISPDPGTLTLTAQPSGTVLGTAPTRAGALTGPVSGASIAEAQATGSLAAGLAGLQSWIRRDSDDRALEVSACAVPRAEHWLLAGGGDSTRRERLVLANPGANALTVDVEVFGAAGRVGAVNSRLSVGPHARTALLVDAIAPGEVAPAVHVVASGGLVTAILEDRWIDGATARGGDDVESADGPATEAIIPGGFVSGPARVRVLVPGTGEAVVQTRVLTPDGPLAVPTDGVVRVKGGTTHDIDLGALPPGAYAVQVRADLPIVAAVMAERRAAAPGQSDLGWMAATAPVGTLAGTPLPPAATLGDGAHSTLLLVGTAASWSAAVFVVGADGVVSTHSAGGNADTVQSIDVSGASAVWVRPATGTVRAGLAIEVPDAAGPLFSMVGLAPAALTATEVPVREIRR